MKKLLTSLLFLVLCGAASANGLNFKAQNGVFVDSTGSEVFLRGYGLGGWLVPEGYMLHTPGFGSPTSIREMITDLIGEENTAEFYRRYEANYVAEADIAKIAEWGFNSIRLPLHYNKLSPMDSAGFLEEGFAVIDTVIAWCRKYDLYLILDMHAAPGGQNGGNISDSDGTARLWLEEKYKDKTVAIWSEISRRYKDEAVIAGYDLINEPVLPSGVPGRDLRALYVRLTNAIRDLGDQHVLFVEGNTYATDFSELVPPWDFNISYSFHKYWSETTKGTIQTYLNMRRDWGIPLWMGESGENSNPWFYETIRLLEQENVSWCWWTHKKLATITSPYSAPILPGYQQVLDYWNGRASRPSQNFATAALWEMADNLALDKCTYRPDLLPSMLNENYGTETMPYMHLEVPGMIPAYAYDIGNINQAYGDNDWKKTYWDADQPWNRGYELRNDGVDLEKSNASDGAEYSIGWIEDGEWVDYTVDVTESGGYNLTLYVASQSGGGQISVYVNGSKVAGPVAVAATGGWYSWKELSLKDTIEMSAGSQELRLVFEQGGFNLQQFRLDNVSSIGGPGAQPESFRLEQNYPNPFNPGTSIEFFIASPGRVVFEVFDIRGRKVESRTLTYDSAGSKELSFVARELAAGLYTYRITAEGQTQQKKMLYLP